MSRKVRSKEKEVGFLELWDKIRQRALNDISEAHEIGGMLNNLHYYLKLAKKNCSYRDREIYDALYFVLRERMLEKQEDFETSKITDISTTNDSGFETYPESHVSETIWKLDKFKATSLYPRVKTPYKVIPSTMIKAATVEESVFDEETRGLEKDRPYPYMTTALLCFACIIALAPHHFFPWFVPWTSFSSPPPI